jgi:hypothetical protein
MSFPTVEAFTVVCNGWDANLLQHPMMVFMHEHSKLFDRKDYSQDANFFQPDAVYIKSDGQAFHGFEAATKQMHADYDLFAQSFHEPKYGVITAIPGREAEAGYRLFGQATIYGNLVGPPVGEEQKKFTDLQGRKWEVSGEGAFIFEVVPDADAPHGFKFTHFQIFADPTPIIATAIKRGVIPIEALTGGA